MQAYFVNKLWHLNVNHLLRTKNGTNIDQNQNGVAPGKKFRNGDEILNFDLKPVKKFQFLPYCPSSVKNPQNQSCHARLLLFRGGPLAV
jgi:hypothetical protein